MRTWISARNTAVRRRGVVQPATKRTLGALTRATAWMEAMQAMMVDGTGHTVGRWVRERPRKLRRSGPCSFLRRSIVLDCKSASLVES